jgi:hypothetical protein
MRVKKVTKKHPVVFLTSSTICNKSYRALIRGYELGILLRRKTKHTYGAPKTLNLLIRRFTTVVKQGKVQLLTAWSTTRIEFLRLNRSTLGYMLFQN